MQNLSSLTKSKFFKKKIYLGGASGVGKSTVAMKIAKIINLPVFEVEAKNCWNKPVGIIRQKCFAYEFVRKMFYGDGIYTNHIIAVYGYTMVMGIKGLKEELETATLLNKNNLILLSLKDKNEMRKRIKMRKKLDKDREQNIVEDMIDIHYKAQQYMIDFALKNNIPIVYTDNKTVDDIAIEIMKLM